MGTRGAVATSQPLAALAGMEMLWAGGNAVDAAVASAIALTVVEPTSNGIGSDAFAIVWDGKLHGLNASGKSPQSLKLEQFAGLKAITASDLAQHQADWVTPISANYRGFTVWELPPNTQGIATLMALNILSGFDLSKIKRESSQSYHLQIEAMKLAFADLYRYIADERFLEVPVSQLLSLDYAASRRSLIGDKAIAIANFGLPKGGTVYLAAADSELMVSFIQSNYLGFGSGVLPAGTGIALQNRGCSFTLEQGHPNQIAPGKRSLHTIIPGFLTQDNQPIGPFGVMGGEMQPQGHLQVVVNMVDYGLNPQSALDAPRWQFVKGSTVLVEQTVASKIVEELQQRGHEIVPSPPEFFGRGQIISKHNQVLIAASEPRTDGLAVAW
ncbi:hypothetical protein NUACC21_51650 [Scytonema sp. NUACC21]